MNKEIKKLAQQAQLALLYEVSCLDKPGLVSPIDSGSHQDMDLFTFLESSVVLLPFFEKFVHVGWMLKEKPTESTFSAIRNIGLEAEKAMYAVTGGVNTHKGAIFSLGIFLAACGRLTIWQNNITLVELQKTIQLMSKDLLIDFENLAQNDKKEFTWGEYLFVTYGMTGIRGEANKGYPAIFDTGLPYYLNHYGNQQNKMIDTLLQLALVIEDTNIIKRSKNVAIEVIYRPLICKYFDKGGSYTCEGRDYLIELNQLFKDKNWSIGGSADSLILVLFLAKIINLNWIQL